MKYAYERKR